MIIINLTPGLGNQMFQFALGKSLSLSKNTPLLMYKQDKYDERSKGDFELEKVFNTGTCIATPKELKEVLGLQSSQKIMKILRSRKLGFLRNANYVVEPSFAYYQKVFDCPNSAFVRGFWQSERYFSSIRKELLIDFSFDKSLSTQNLQVLEKLKGKTSVSIHIRRGDYITNLEVNKEHGTLGNNYYQSAIKDMDERYQNTFFVLLSDEPEWVRENFATKLLPRNNYVIVSHNSGDESYNDMRLMSLCNHNIIANSSFSWWGAWLNQNPEKIVIAPKKWFAVKKDTKDLLPATWSLL